CQGRESNRLSDARSKEMEKKQNDPMMMARFQTLAMTHAAATNQAMQSGDTVALAKENADYMTKMMAIMGADGKADSVAVEKKCGALPAEPAWVKVRDKMQKDAEDARGEYKMADSEVMS